MMNDHQEVELFQWPEVKQIFCIKEEPDFDDQRRKEILAQINRVAERHGRDYVIKRIALAY